MYRRTLVFIFFYCIIKLWYIYHSLNIEKYIKGMVYIPYLIDKLFTSTNPGVSKNGTYR